MSIYYPSGCDSSLQDHVCDPCPTTEGGRIRSIAYVHKDFEFTDPADPSEWETGIASGDIIVIPETNGSFDGGTPTFGTGYGSTNQRYLGSEFKINYKDPNWYGNCDFYNTIRNNRNFKIAFCTENYVRISTATATVYGKDPVQDDLNSEVVWEVEVTFKQSDTPCPYAIPDGIFTCFEVL